VIVRLDNRRSRDLVYSVRIELRNSRPVPTPIYINEQRKVMTYFWNAEECGKVENSKYVDMERQRIQKTPGKRRWSHRQVELSGGSQQCVILTNFHSACWCEPTFNWDIFSIICLMLIHFIMTYHMYLRLTESVCLSIRM